MTLHVTQLWMAAAGGALGAASRLVLTHWVALWLGRGLPWGTLVVNTLGAFLMGLLVMAFLHKWPASVETKTFFVTGFLGALTTFSAFSLETYTLLQSAHWAKAMFNVALNVILTLVAVAIGVALGKVWWQPTA